MSTDPEIQNQVYQCFIAEAPSLLQAIEQDLLSFFEEQTVEKIQNLMRNAHTLKGSAGSVERETIRTVAHHLEDVFTALCEPSLTVDEELSALLWESYECLRAAVTAELAYSSSSSADEDRQSMTDSTLDETEILNRTASILAKLQDKLGDFFGREAPLPTSEELGFDVVGSIFAESMQQELQQLAFILATKEPEQVASSLRSEAEFLLGLAESYNLPGMGEIAQAILTALERYPEQVLQIAGLALVDLQQARAAVLAGDRSRGGEPSIALLELAGIPQESESTTELAETTISESWSQLTSAFSQQEVAVDESESEVASTIETNDNSEQGQIQSNRQESETDFLPLVEQPTENTPSSEQPDAAIDRILQAIGVQEQELTANESPIPSESAPQEQTVPKRRSTLNFTSPQQEVRVELLQLEQLNHIFGELLIAQNQQTWQTDQSQEYTREALRQLQLCQQRLNKIRNWSDKNTFSLSKVSQKEGFDALEMDAYSELHLVIQSILEGMMVLQESLEEVKLNLGQSQLTLKKQQRLLSNSQENLLQARMLPLGTLLSRFPPIIKQLVAAQHKPTELELSGTQILIDKTISEKLFDPLLHLLRNAIAHGIESPEIRHQQGKPETGRIRIHAYHQGNRTTIEVADDGQGLDWNQIRQRSIEQQFLSPTQADMASEAELAELLFEPGFSTTKQLTELSGRGVGLDVVRTQIQGLQGSVTVSSVTGEGTVFSLHLPLVLMTARSLVCQSNGLPYALLAESIERVLLPEPAQISSQPILEEQENHKFLLWGEGQARQKVPIRTLASLLAYSFPTESFSTNTPLKPTFSSRHQVAPLLMLRQHDQLLCLEVEQILTKQELAIKSLSRKPMLPSYIQGYSVLSDGRLTLAIDPLELVNQNWNQTDSFGQATLLPEVIATPPAQFGWSSQSESLLLPASANSDPQASPSNQIQSILIADNPGTTRPSPTLAIQGQLVLIVDDSLPQRKLLTLTLEKAGYSVLQAGDGQEALTVLRQHSTVRLIICDIEMPRMNGFEFLYAYRQDSSLSKVDVIMLTSRSSPKHRQMAFDLGARAYLTKPCSEQELLGLLSDLISQKKTNISTAENSFS